MTARTPISDAKIVIGEELAAKDCEIIELKNEAHARTKHLIEAQAEVNRLREALNLNLAKDLGVRPGKPLSEVMNGGQVNIKVSASGSPPTPGTLDAIRDGILAAQAPCPPPPKPEKPAKAPEMYGTIITHPERQPDWLNDAADWIFDRLEAFRKMWS